MIGFYAEYPEVNKVPGIILTSESYAPSSGGLKFGYNAGGRTGDDPQGSINPIGSLVIPNSDPSPGSNGQLMELAYYTNANGSYPQMLWMLIRGNYASLGAVPFTTLYMNEVARAKTGGLFSSITISGVPHVTVAWNYGATNPLPVGPVSIRFA